MIHQYSGPAASGAAEKRAWESTATWAELAASLAVEEIKAEAKLRFDSCHIPGREPGFDARGREVKQRASVAATKGFLRDLLRALALPYVSREFLLKNRSILRNIVLLNAVAPVLLGEVGHYLQGLLDELPPEPAAEEGSEEPS